MPFQRFSENITCWYCRLSHPHIWEAKPVVIQGVPRSEPRFSAILILHPEIVKKIRAIENRLISQSWPEWSGVQPPPGITLRHALQEGSVVRPGDPHLEGKWILSANAKAESPPWVVEKDPVTGNFLPATDRTRVYGGAEAHVNVGIYTTQIKATEPQINVGLNGLQLTPNQLPSFENRISAEQALQGGPDIAAPPPPPGGPDIQAPVYGQSQASPTTPAAAQLDFSDPLSW